MWQLVAANKENYINPLFMNILNNRVLLPIAAVRHLKFWKSLYRRWVAKVQLQVSSLNTKTIVLTSFEVSVQCF